MIIKFISIQRVAKIYKHSLLKMKGERTKDTNQHIADNGFSNAL